MAYNKTSSKYPTPPERGRSSSSGGRPHPHMAHGEVPSSEAKYVARDGIVMSPRPSGEATVGFNKGKRDLANYGALGGGVGHIVAPGAMKAVPVVAVPAAISTGAADAYDANRATTALRQQTAETDAWAEQPFSGTFMKGDREAWDATYDDPRRANPPEFKTMGEQDAWERKVAAAEEARHPIRAEYSRRLENEQDLAGRHREAIQQRRSDSDTYNERALQDAVVIGSFGAFSGAHPVSTSGRLATAGTEGGAELGGKYVGVPAVMTAAGAKGAGEDQSLVTNMSRAEKPAPQRKGQGIAWQSTAY